MSTFDGGPVDTSAVGEDHQPREGWFVRTAGAVGDLGNPFYREERQRDVWNEASAVGFQLVLWLGMAAAAAMIWIGGAVALPYAVTLYAVIGIPAVVTLTYSTALGVSGTEGVRMLRARVVIYALLLAAFIVGAVRAVPAEQGGFVGGMAQGAVVGAVIAAVLVVVAVLSARRSSQRRR